MKVAAETRTHLDTATYIVRRAWGTDRDAVPACSASGRMGTAELIHTSFKRECWLRLQNYFSSFVAGPFRRAVAQPSRAFVGEACCKASRIFSVTPLGRGSRTPSVASRTPATASANSGS